MQNDFKIGDTVRLKSGGTLMTIETIRGDAKDIAECVWHGRNIPYCIYYNFEVLQHSSDIKTETGLVP